MTELPVSRAGLPRARRPRSWQRRFLLRHFQDHGDAALARATGLSVSAVQAFLASQAAVRTAAQAGRIAKHEQRGSGPELPPCRSPRDILALATRIESRPLERLDALLVGLMFLGSAVLYGLTAARAVTGEDAGELLAAAHGFGVPHPPGYPLWLLLAWAADHGLHFGSAAWRVSMVSAVFSAAANAILLAIALKTLRHRAVALLGAALFAVSLTHWSQAVIPEVYGLSTFFVALSVLLVVRLKEQPTAGRLLVLATVVGLSATNHPTAFPVALVLVLAAITFAPHLFRRPAVVLSALLAGLLPLLLYGILPLASGRDPYIDWGNPETLDSLVAHVTRSQYEAVEEGARAGNSYGDYLRRLSILARSMGQQFGSPWVLLLAVVGFFGMFVRQTGLWFVLLLIGWFCSIGITQFSSYSFDREHVYANQIFFIPAWLTVAWLIAGGLDVLIGAAREAWRERGLSIPLRLATAAVALGMVALPIRAHFDRVDRSNTQLVAAYGKALLDTMEEGALYFPASDHSTFALMHWQGVLGYRTDVVVADKYGRIEQDLVDLVLDEPLRAAMRGQRAAEQRRLLEAALITSWPGPVYFANHRDMTDVPGKELVGTGPLYKVMATEEAAAWWAPGEGGGEPPGLAFWRQFEGLDLDDPVEGLDFTVQMVRGDLLSMRGIAQMRAGRMEEALATWRSIEADLAPIKQIFNNIGSSLADARRLPDALVFYERALAEDPAYEMALRNAAIVARDLHERPRAIELLQRLVALAPDHDEAQLELARLLEQGGGLHEALLVYEGMAAADRRDSRPWVEAGRLLEKHGDLEKAKAAYVEALRLQPSRRDVAEALDRLQKGIPRLLAEAPPSPWEQTGPAHGTIEAALAEVDACYGAGEIGPPMPRFPGAVAVDSLLPGVPLPPDPTRGLLPKLPTSGIVPGGVVR